MHMVNIDFYYNINFYYLYSNVGLYRYITATPHSTVCTHLPQSQQPALSQLQICTGI